MNLLEYKSKELFQKHNIAIPRSVVISPDMLSCDLSYPFMLKSQVPVGDRKRKGGIVEVGSERELQEECARLFSHRIDGHFPEILLAEEKVSFIREYYVSVSFDTSTRAPVLSLSCQGGTGISSASTVMVDPLVGLADFVIRHILSQAGLKPDLALISVIKNLWKVFTQEHAVLAEINPLFKLEDGSYAAGDAKIILDDAVHNPRARPYVDLDGDIAIIASGGGASMVNMDALIRCGGKPANYVEYSGNPKAEVVAELTKNILAKPGIKGCWVIGGTANFTDIYETLSGFVEGLKNVTPKPTYPIVIRRDGPRREEAFAMLEEIKEKEGFNFHLYGPEVPMAKTANILVNLVYEHTG